MKRLLATALLGTLFLSLQTCANPPPKLEHISFPDWEVTRHSYEGKVLVVNIWASWCRPCVELFPSMAELQTQYEPSGVQFVSLCLDDLDKPEEIEATEDFLANTFGDPPQLESFHYSLEEDFADIMDRLVLPTLPSILVYDAEGQLRYKLSGDELDNEVTPADIEDAIESLIEVSRPS